MSRGNILLILSGFGISEPSHENPLTLAPTPNLNYLWQSYPSGYIKSFSSQAYQDLNFVPTPEINLLNISSVKNNLSNRAKLLNSLQTKTLGQNPYFLDFISKAKQSLHIFSSITEDIHLELLANLNQIFASFFNLKILLHLTISGKHSEKTLEKTKKIQSISLSNPNFKILSICGEDFSQNTSLIWSKTKVYFDFLTTSTISVPNFEKFLERHFLENKTLDNFPPLFISEPQNIKKDEKIFFLNLDGIEFLQIQRAFTESASNFWQGKKEISIEFINLFGISEYGNQGIFKSIVLDNSALLTLDKMQKKQLFLFEEDKEKLLNSFVVPFDKTNFLSFIKLPTSINYTQVENILKMKDYLKVNLEKFDFFYFYITEILSLSYHSDLAKMIESIKILDSFIGYIADLAMKNDLSLTITSDIGKIENINNTTFTSNALPLLFVEKNLKNFNISGIFESQIFPTIFKILNLEKPNYFEAKPIF